MLKEKLSILMDSKKINKAQLSKGADIPYTTIDGIFKKDSDNTKINTLKKLANFFECSIDYLIDDDNLDPNPNATINDSVDTWLAIVKNSAISGLDVTKISDKELRKIAKQMDEYMSFVSQKYKI